MSILSGQIALITGASGGIGGAIALSLSTQGTQVCLCGRDRAKLDAMVEKMTVPPPAVDVRPCDLTQDHAIAGLAEHIRSTYGRLDILVHCAGAIGHGKLEQAPITALDGLYQTNVRGPLLLTQLLLPLLKQPRGQVVFINSSVGLTARPNTGHFSATQHAFKALADSLRDEVNGDNIRVLSVYPGRTATPRIAALHAREGRPYQPELLLQPEDIASVVTNALSLPWTAEVTNISIRPMQKSY